MSLLAVLLALAVPGSGPIIGATRITESGPIEHPGAAISFPDRIGDFVRMSGARYTRAGPSGIDHVDMSAEYELRRDGGIMFATIYIYPPSLDDAAEDCGDQLASAVGDITGRFAGATPAPGELLAPPHRPSGNGRHRRIFTAEHSVYGVRQPVRTEVSLFCAVRGWHVKYRFTATRQIDAEPLIRGFMLGAPWPVRERGTVVTQAGAAERAAR